MLEVEEEGFRNLNTCYLHNIWRETGDKTRSNYVANHEL